MKMARSLVRYKVRNLFIWDLQTIEDRVPLGGLCVTAGMTHTDFHQMLDILVIVSSDYIIQNQHGDEILRDSQPLLPGNYMIIADTVQVNNEVAYIRAYSISTGIRVKSFKEAVQARDNRCVISKIERPHELDWVGFEAAHIFPLAYEQHWIENNYARWITIDPPQGGKINSVQNGLLLRSHLHALFDSYYFSINPDNGYKIVYFVPDADNLAGQCLDDRLLSNPLRPPDALLRWHFRQAVLTNMRGIGEPTHDLDFPPGSDMVGEILAGPKASERMEFELFDRLAHHTEIVEAAIRI